MSSSQSAPAAAGRSSGEQAILDRVQQAVRQDSRNRELLDRHEELRRRLEALTPRERQVLDRVVLGKQNKQIAAELGISIKTVYSKKHKIQSRLEALLARPKGATMAQLEKSLGWQPHTVRAAISRLRKSGAVVSLDRSGKTPTYRIGSAT